jgi:hypothetical protein
VLSQELSEQAVESAVKGTEVIGVSFMSLLVFHGHDSVTRDAFSQTDDVVKLHQSLLPSPDALIAWVSRLKALHSQLRAFRLIIEYDLMEADLPDDNVILTFEYHEAAEDAGAYPQPLNREDKDLRFQHLDGITDQCRYEVYPNLVKACYDSLVRDAETLREEAEHEAARQATIAEMASLPENEVAELAAGAE